MARTLGEIEALARSQSSLSDEAEKASEKVLNLRGSIVDLTVGTKEHTNALHDLEKATKDEKTAKDEAKRVQLEYNAVVGDSAQSFKQLNQDIDEFIGSVTLNKQALDKLGIGAQNIADQYQINAQMQGANLQKINQINEDITKYQKNGHTAIVVARKRELAFIEDNNKILARIGKQLGGVFADINNIGTSSAKTEVDSVARDQLMRDAKALPASTKEQKAQRAATITGLEDSFEQEDKIVMLNKGFKTASEQVKNVASGITDITDKIPLVGGAISGFINKQFSEAVGLVGNDLREGLKGNEEGLKKSGIAARLLNSILKMNPLVLMATLALGVFFAIRNINKAARGLANELGMGKDQLEGQLVALKAQEIRFQAIGLDADKLKTTLTTLSTEFKDLSLVTAENAANIEKFAQNSGIGGEEVAKLTKQLMVTEGISFDMALSMQEQAAAMAKTAGIAKGRILNDMASNAEKFARFSMDGADGLAEAAVAANQMGLNLEKVLKVAGDLLDFESSITKEFEAQVLTGKAINLEAARQAALSGDNDSLMREIKSVAMGVNLETMNVVQKDAIAGAIGLSVSDLMRVSRGESLDKQETQIDLQKKTNDILIAGFKDESGVLDKIANNTEKSAGGPNMYGGVVDSNVNMG
jgi:hypothetical protein